MNLPNDTGSPCIHFILPHMKTNTAHYFSVWNMFGCVHWMYIHYQRGNWLHKPFFRKVSFQPGITIGWHFVGDVWIYAHILLPLETELIPPLAIQRSFERSSTFRRCLAWFLMLLHIFHMLSVSFFTSVYFSQAVGQTKQVHILQYPKIGNNNAQLTIINTRYG